MTLYIFIWFILGFVGMVLVNVTDIKKGVYTTGYFFKRLTVGDALLMFLFVFTGPVIFFISICYYLSNYWLNLGKLMNTRIYDIVRKS